MAIICPECGKEVDHLLLIDLPAYSSVLYKELCKECLRAFFDEWYLKDKEDVYNYFSGVEKRYDPDLLHLLEKYPVEFKTRLDKDS